MGGEEQSDSDNSADVFFESSEESNPSSEYENDLDDQEAKYFYFYMLMNEKDFH